MEQRSTYQQTTRDILEQAAAVTPFMVVGAGTLQGLAGELGSVEAGLFWLVGLAARRDQPIAVHLAGTTTVLSPPNWSSERLTGWIAPHLESLQQAFGAVTGLFSPGHRGEGEAGET